MDISLILTIVFGIISLFGIFLGWKAWHRPRLKLVFARSTLLANLSKATKEITVSYKGAEVPNDLILIEGYLLNAGNTDIKREDVEDPIKISLGKDWLWHSFHIRNISPGLKLSAEIINNSVNINLGLCKKGEGLYFDGLISVEDGASLSSNREILKNIKIYSRITNVDRIEKVKLPTDFEKNGVKIFDKDYLFINIFLIVLVIFMAVSTFGSYEEVLTYEFQSVTGAEVSIGFDDLKEVQVRDTKTNKIIENNNGYYELKPIIYKKENNIMFKILPYISLVICSLCFFIINYLWLNRYLLLVKVRKIEKVPE